MMMKGSSNSPLPNGGGPQKEQDHSKRSNNSMLSTESASQTASSHATNRNNPNQGVSSHSRKSLPVGDLATMEGAGESVSAFTDTNTSTSRSSSLDIGVGPYRGKASIGSTLPPSSIIQQLDDDSEPLINLDSLQVSERESDVSDLNGTAPRADDNKTSWLNIDSSSTSQGSQGSYAHQVPNLLGSYGSRSHGNDMDYKEFGLPQRSIKQHPTRQSPEKRHSAQTESSHFPQIDTPQNSNLTDILGPKGLPLDDSLGPSLDPGEEPVQSDLDDILGPQTYVESSDLDDTLGPYEGSTVGPSTIGPSTVGLSTIASTIASSRLPIPEGKAGYNSEYAHFRDIDKKSNPPKTNTGKLASLKVNDTIVYCSPAEAPIGDPSSRTFKLTPSATRRAIVNIGEALNDRDKDEADSYAWSPRETSILSEAYSDENRKSHHSRAEAPSMPDIKNSSEHAKAQGLEPPRNSLSADFVESASTWESKGTGISQATKSSAGSASNAETATQLGDGSSFLANDTLSPNNGSSLWGGSSRDATFSPNSCVSESDAEFSYSTSRRGDSELTPTGHTAGTQFTFGTRATSASAMASINESIDEDASEGGRMWQAAQIQAKNSKDRPLSPRAKKFADSIMARTRSRADTDALVDNPSKSESVDKPTRSMINVNDQEEGGIIQSTSIARKRERVIQLLTVGLLSFLIAFLGGFFVMSSCHFVSVVVEVGETATEFDLHFGLWKYSPADSAFQGYTYCSHYDDGFVSGTPWFGRISSLIALACGGFSLFVLWLYLVLGRCAQNVWNMAIFSAAMSGGLQLCTLSILTGPMCREGGCVIGPAGIISIIAGCCYFVLAFEMHYNAPLVNVRDDFDQASSRVDYLEMSNFEYGAKAYVHRIAFGNNNPYPTVHQHEGEHQRQHNDEPKDDNEMGPYVPPPAIV